MPTTLCYFRYVMSLLLSKVVTKMFKPYFLKIMQVFLDDLMYVEIRKII
jgi:hypothetical protein